MSVHGKEVLIIDDAPDVRMLCRKILENLGIVVTEADSVVQALTVLSQKVPHLVILDLEMPGKSGFDFLAARKKVPTLAAIPVIVSSGLADRESIYKAMTLGANDYVIKPMSATILAQRVRKHVRDLDFKRYKFKKEEQPKLWMNFAAEITRIEETSFNLESPVRLERVSQVGLDLETMASLGLDGNVLVTSQDAGVRGSSGQYTSRVTVLGITETLLKKRRGKKHEPA